MPPAAAAAPLLDERDGAEADADDERTRSIVVTVPSAYSDGEVTFSVMLQISSGSVLSEPGGLQGAGELVIGQREAEQRHRHQARRQDRNDHEPDGLPGAGAEIAGRLFPGAVEARHHREHHQHAERQRPGQLRPERGVYQLASMPSTLQIRPTPMPSTRPGATRLPIIR